jgi:hypothetical protein
MIHKRAANPDMMGNATGRTIYMEEDRMEEQETGAIKVFALTTMGISE